MGLEGESPGLQGFSGERRQGQELCKNAFSCSFSSLSSPAEESAPNHSCQSPSPASQDGEEEKEGTLFPERTLPARNAKVRGQQDGWGRHFDEAKGLTGPASSFLCQLQDPALAPRPPKPVAVPRGRRPPQEPGVREEAEAGDATPGGNKPQLRLGSQQDQEEPEVQGLPPWLKGGLRAPLGLCCPHQVLFQSME